jgi:hypothetical protein
MAIKDPVVILVGKNTRQRLNEVKAELNLKSVDALLNKLLEEYKWTA